MLKVLEKLLNPSYFRSCWCWTNTDFVDTGLLIVVVFVSVSVDCVDRDAFDCMLLLLLMMLL